VSGSEEKVLSWLKQFSAAEILERADEALFRLDPALDRIASDPHERLMTWDEMRSLAKQGHMLASHTCTHPLLTHLGGRAVAEELHNSWLDLNTKIWHGAGSSAWISYPNGDVDSSVQAAAHRAGYRYGFTTVPGVWPGRGESLSIPRVNIWDGSLLSSDGTFNENSLAHNLFWRPDHATRH
jgi:peptidoglycan/xylan/chitin deacetylase (PgdA/CDA1 family)